MRVAQAEQGPDEINVQGGLQKNLPTLLLSFSSTRLAGGRRAYYGLAATFKIHPLPYYLQVFSDLPRNHRLSTVGTTDGTRFTEHACKQLSPVSR